MNPGSPAPQAGILTQARRRPHTNDQLPLVGGKITTKLIKLKGSGLARAQVISYNDPTWITTYVSKNDSQTKPPSSGDSNFRIASNGVEAVDTHEIEEIGYIMIGEGYDVLSTIKLDAQKRQTRFKVSLPRLLTALLLTKPFLGFQTWF